MLNSVHGADHVWQVRGRDEAVVGVVRPDGRAIPVLAADGSSMDERDDHKANVRCMPLFCFDN